MKKKLSLFEIESFLEKAINSNIKQTFKKISISKITRTLRQSLAIARDSTGQGISRKI